VSDAVLGEGGVRPRRRLVALASGGAALWAGMVAFGGSTVAVLAILSRHLGHPAFAALSALLSLSFVVSLIPAGVQLRSASLVTDGRPPPRLEPRQAVVVTCVSLAVAPLLALLLRVPVAAAALVTVQMVVAIPLAGRQGALLAQHRFGALGTNLVIEGTARVLLGSVVGFFFGVTGLAAGLCAGTIVALATLPRWRSGTATSDRPRTSLLDTSLSLALLGLYVQLDVLIAPSVLGHGGAVTYDLAAVPSKGVYLVLLAAGPLLFPFVRRQGEPRLVLRAAGVTLGAGLACAGLVLVARPVVAAVLGQPRATIAALVLLGTAMALAGVSSLVTSAGVARGVVRPWPPLALGIVVELSCLAFHPPPGSFAVVVTVAQLLTAVLCTIVCLRGRQRSADGHEATATEQRSSGLASREAWGLVLPMPSGAPPEAGSP
jgi:hypothetical protein